MSTRRAFVAAVAAYVAALVVAALTLPGRVPMHFDAAGVADSWSHRPEAVLTLAVVGLAVGGLLGGVAATVGSGQFPLTLVNLPQKAWWTATPERERRLRTMLTTDLWGLAAGVMWFLVLVAALTMAVAHESDPRLGGWGFGLVILVLVAVLGWTVWMLRRYRVPRE